MKRLLMAMAVSGALAGTAHGAVQLISNGDFEGNTLAGWTVNTGGPFASPFFVIANGGNVPLSNASTAVLATGGNFVAVSDQIGPGGGELRQGFTVAAGTTSLILEFDWFNNTHSPYQGGTGVIDGSNNEQHGRIDILAAGASALDVGAGVVQSLRFDAGTFTPGLSDTIPWVHEVFDLSSLAPGSYELRFGNGQCCFYQELGVDNVSLLAETPEPATVALFGLGLAGIGMARRRSIARQS